MAVASIGNTTFDYTIYGNGFLKEGDRNRFTESHISTGGPAATAAYVIAKFGESVDFYGQVGNDIFGQYTYNDLKKSNIDISNFIVSDKIKTPFSYIYVNQENDTRTINTVRDKEKDSKLEVFDDNKVRDKYYPYILSDGKYYNETSWLYEKCGGQLVLDAGTLNDDVYYTAYISDIIICSEEFVYQLYGLRITYDFEENRKIYETLKGQFPWTEKIVITLGSKGYLYEQDGAITIVPAYQSGKTTIDTTGAGDIFHGAFVYAMSNNYSYEQSLRFANITASLSTTKRGGKDSCPELSEVLEIYNKIYGNKTYIKKL